MTVSPAEVEPVAAVVGAVEVAVDPALVSVAELSSSEQAPSTRASEAAAETARL
ncbi:MAG: hypothetical protein M3508_00860 [Actinomycetota bacterium]|nr:hypothetical protein [Actinomycetota bacterium]